MDLSTRKGMAVLSMILALVLTIILVFAFLKAGTQLWRPNVDNSELLETFVERVNSVSLPDTIPEGESFHVYDSQVPFTITEKELFLFFSGGNDSIWLAFNPTDDFEMVPEISSKLIGGKYFYEFKRPNVNQCNNQACVCYCDDGPYWTSIDEWPYVSPQKIIVGKSYTCPEPVCMSFAEENLVFGNGRGRVTFDNDADDDRYVEDVLELRESSDKSDEGFVAQSMDVVTLIQPALFDWFNSRKADHAIKEGRDFLFDLKDKKYAYNLEDQDKDIVWFVSSGMRWESGVVIGGMGFAKNKAQAKKRILEGPAINVELEQRLELNEAGNIEGHNVIGVGFPVDPLSYGGNGLLRDQQKALDLFSEKMLLISEIQSLVTDETFIESFEENSPNADKALKYMQEFSVLMGKFLVDTRETYESGYFFVEDGDTFKYSCPNIGYTDSIYFCQYHQGESIFVTNNAYLNNQIAGHFSTFMPQFDYDAIGVFYCREKEQDDRCQESFLQAEFGKNNVTLSFNTMRNTGGAGGYEVIHEPFYEVTFDLPFEVYEEKENSDDVFVSSKVFLDAFYDDYTNQYYFGFLDTSGHATHDYGQYYYGVDGNNVYYVEADQSGSWQLILKPFDIDAF